MDLKDIHDIIDKITRKEVNGWLSPEQKDLALHQASLWVFNQRYKSYAVNQESQDDLAPFKKEYLFTNETTPDGVITLPGDYMHFLGGYIQSYDNSIGSVVYNGFDIVNDDELPIRISSQLIPVTETERVGQWLGKRRIRLWPRTPAAGYALYLKTPSAPKYNYSVVDRRIIYNAGESTQLEWDENNIINAVLPRAISILGVPLEADAVIKYVEGFKA